MVAVYLPRKRGIEMTVVENMKRMERAMNEELHNIIPYYRGEVDTRIVYHFDYTELNNTKLLQEKAIEDLKAFVKKYNGVPNKEITSLAMDIEISFPCI